ncbi:TetR family transcriptional regulator [Achromobacter sp. RTa]|uniref:TetR family transcriptional regulator n=1 Tax=Achromobacter sp. RTa TaxID=1532557 RepID=UPI0012DFF95B|nr:TetR family transcriptional regulator [Achromobacter sp. RTa]
MTLSWPPAPGVSARWLARARRLAALPEDAAVSPSVSQSGLAALCGAQPPSPPATLLAVIEILSARRPALSVSLAAAWCAAAAAGELAAARSKREPAGAWASPAQALDPATGRPSFLARPEGRSWRVQGGGRWIGADPGAPLLVFAHHADAGAVSAFLLPVDAPGIEPGRAGPIGGMARVDAHVGPDCLLGPAGQARDAMLRTDALRRLAAAAQANGVTLAAYAEAANALQPDEAAPARGALELAACASAFAAARALLHEAAAAAHASQDIRLLSAMALLSAGESAERMLAAAMKLAGSSPLADPAALQALLRARHVHQAAACAQEAQTVLLAGAIQPPQASLSGTSAAMSNTPIPRAGDLPDRVAEILDAAADAFTQQTYDATTLDQIGDALGVTKGSIYHHYRSKAHLFTAVYQRALEMNIATVEPIARQPGVRAVDRLYRMAYAHAMQVMKHLSYQRVAVQGLESHLMGRINEEQRARLDAVISLRDHYEELFVNVLTQAIDAGELPRQNPRLAAKPLFGAINWTTMWYQPRPGETPADRERLATHLATFVLSGLTQAYQPAADMQTGAPADAAHRQ